MKTPLILLYKGGVRGIMIRFKIVGRRQALQRAGPELNMAGAAMKTLFFKR